MKPLAILLASALAALAAAAAAAGSLDFWEDSRGAQDVTAAFPTGAAQTAHVVFDASSAESGGLLVGATEIEIRAQGSIDFVRLRLRAPGLQRGATTSSTRVRRFQPGPGRLAVSDPDFEPKAGLYDLGTITFDRAAASPARCRSSNCNYTGSRAQNEHTCNQFVLVTLPEPAGSRRAVAAVALLLRAAPAPARAPTRVASR